ncbi:MAG: 23S rRNA (uracil(1939)-C(5))-methyltransferase RlmD [Bacteroidales bacterium]
MARKKRRDFPTIEKMEILDAGSEGKAIGKFNERVVFVPYVVPGDVVDVKVHRQKKSWFEGRAIHFHKKSEKRIEAKCEHFGICGGCKWQNMSYDDQLFYKQKQVKDNLERIGKFPIPEILPILQSERTFYYRNKMEFTFSNKRWLTEYSKGIDFDEQNMNALGFHVPGLHTRVVDLNNCYLQEEPSNTMRLAIKKYADQKGLTFYNVKDMSGFLRNLLIRITSTGQLMVILVMNNDEREQIKEIMDFIDSSFPGITSLNYVINPKVNDIITDLEIITYKGEPFIIEEMEGLQFKIGPVSFYQTNSLQAYELYKVARAFADLKGDELVYDLYTGTGTIANFIASKAKKVVGIEYVESAVLDAIENSKINNIKNTSFFAGDLAKVLNEEFTLENGNPDVIITDPPRAGMHEKVIKQILRIAPEKIVYVSCNPATQARDVALMADDYEVAKIQPVDMFPQTHHVENVMLLVRKN